MPPRPLVKPKATSNLNGHRILGLADQPWQTQILSSFLDYIKSQNSKIETKLYVADYFSILHDPGLLSTLRESTDFEIFDLNTLYRSWQTDNLPSEAESRLIINSWHHRYTPTRSIHQISASNQLIHGWEREKYYLPLTTEWADKIIADTIVYCESLMDNVKPDIVISIERVNLSFNIVYEMCKSKGIPYLLIAHSRIQNRWSYRLDFGLGNEEPVFASLKQSTTNSDLLHEQVVEFIDFFRKNSISLYTSISEKLNERITTTFFERTKYLLFGELHTSVISWPRLLRKIINRLIRRKIDQAFIVKRLEENLTKLSLWEVKQALTYTLRALGLSLWGDKRFVPNSPYFLWCLHARPEDSTSVLGLGMDEITLLLNTADLLGERDFLVVKEHPVMLGIRSLGFYKKLKSHPKIILIDAFSDSQEVLRNIHCLGSIGLSGTILLESALLGKGAFAFGIPEFGHLLDSRHLSLRDFLNGKRMPRYEELTNYLKEIFSHSSNNDPLYLAEWNEEQISYIFPHWWRILQSQIT